VSPQPRGLPTFALALALAVLAAPERATAEEPDAPAAQLIPAKLAWTAGGALVAFTLHEGCHLATNLALGNRPALRPVHFLGTIPFFAVGPDITCDGGRCTKMDGSRFAPGPRGYGAIVSSGTLCQQLTDEAILTAHPRLKDEEAPFLKGMLLFGTSVAAAYAVANLTGLEPPEGDLHSFEQATRAPRGLVAGAVLATAALEVARYYRPDAAWIPWVSRGAKAATIGITVVY